jgi:predicted metalloprotease
MLPALDSTEYSKLSGGVYAYRSDSVVPACSGVRLPYRVVQENAFYCPAEDFVAWDDEKLFPRLSEEYGNFVLSIVLAHEWGHAIQKRQNKLDYMETIISEQQADCLAGAWAGRLGTDSEDAELVALRDAELDRSLAGLIEFRDLVGFAQASAGAHGTAFDRIRAFQEGFESGTETCDEYQYERPLLVGFSYRTITEAIRGGDVDLDKAITTAVSLLEERFAPFKVIEGEPNLFCEDPSDRASRLTNGLVSVCLDGTGTVSFQAKDMRTLYEDYGDFAPSTALAIGVGAAMADRAALVEDPEFFGGGSAEDSTKTEVELDARADYFAGTWAGSLIDFDYPEESLLSPGDLDEAVQTLLRLASESDGTYTGSGFDRVASFRSGVFEDSPVTPEAS